MNLRAIATILEAAGSVGAGDLIAVHPEPLGAGSGFFAALTRLRLVYRRPHEGAPSSLILKQPPTANAERAVLFALHDRESGFYREVAATCSARVPRCYSADAAGILLEDLAGFDPGDELEGLGADRLKAAVEGVGLLHARWWDAEGLGDLSWLPAHNAPVMTQLGDLIRDTWPAFVDRYRGRLPRDWITLGTAVTGCYEEILGSLARGPATFVHGDFRADNLFFSTAGGAAIIDWQLCCRGAGAFDVAHLLAGSAAVETRRRYEFHILRHWYDVTADGRTPYTFHDAFDDYRRGTLAYVGYAVAGDSLDRGDDRGRALAGAQVIRAFTAAADLQALSLLAA